MNTIICSAFICSCMYALMGEAFLFKKVCFFKLKTVMISPKAPASIFSPLYKTSHVFAYCVDIYLRAVGCKVSPYQTRDAPNLACSYLVCSLAVTDHRANTLVATVLKCLFPSASSIRVQALSRGGFCGSVDRWPS